MPTQKKTQISLICSQNQKRHWIRWTPQEDELIRKHYPNIDLPGRSWGDIQRRASRIKASNPPDDPGAAPFVHRWVREWVADTPRAARSVFDLAI